MEFKINGDKEDVSMILVSAVRYGLGRRTYIVSWIGKFVVDNLHLLTDKDKHVMIKDIKNQERFGYGDTCDEAVWKTLLKTLEKSNI